VAGRHVVVEQNNRNHLGGQTFWSLANGLYPSSGQPGCSAGLSAGSTKSKWAVGLGPKSVCAAPGGERS
jgi:hypothetical protein